MKRVQNTAIEAVMKAVDDQAAGMSSEVYGNFLACVIADLRIRLEAVEQEEREKDEEEWLHDED